MSKSYDFTKIYNPKTKAIFRNLPGWRFDEAVWTLDFEQNNEFKLASLADIDISGVPQQLFKSGVGDHLSLELDEINFEDHKTLEGWTPGVKIGSYFIYSEPKQLHSSDSIIKLVGEDLDDDGRSTLELAISPKALTPLTVEYLSRDLNTLELSTSTSFEKVSRFKGLARNGRELDGDIAGNTDESVNQFKLLRHQSAPIKNRHILERDLLEIEPGIYEVSFLTSLVDWWFVDFSRKDIFKTELPFSVFLDRQADPIANGALNDGDYCISYLRQWNEALPARVSLSSLPEDFGTVSYKPAEDSYILFNKNVQIAREQTFSNLNSESLFYLQHLPVLDSSGFSEGASGGSLILDQFNFRLTVAGVDWTRIGDLDNAGVADQVYELDPLNGKILFGDEGVTKNGAIPVGQIVAYYTQVPLVQYDGSAATQLFSDETANLDPLKNPNKKGFLVLSESVPEATTIKLSALGEVTRFTDGSCCYGPIDVPAVNINDIITVRARVTNSGNPRVGVPNIPVRFESMDGVLSFSNDESVTDAEGYAYTEAQGQSNFRNYVVADYMYEPLDPANPDYLNPDPALAPLTPEIPAWGVHIPAPDTLIFGEAFNGDLENVYLLIQSIPSDTPGNILDYTGNPLGPDEYPTPYDARTRQGGVTVVWHQTVLGAEEIVHPIAATPNVENPGWTEFQFPINIPTGRLIVGYKIVIDRRAKLRAVTLTDKPMVSNIIAICTSLNAEMRGQWKLPNLLAPDSDGLTENEPLIENLDGSRISSAVFISPNDFEVTELQPLGGGGPIVTANVTDGIDIIGNSFPTTEELKLSVFIIKTDSDKRIIGVKNISDDSTVIDANTIRIASLPTPPTEEYGYTYWIAVGGFHVEDSSGIRKTAVELEIGAAP